MDAGLSFGLNPIPVGESLCQGRDWRGSFDTRPEAAAILGAEGAAHLLASQRQESVFPVHDRHDGVRRRRKSLFKSNLAMIAMFLFRTGLRQRREDESVTSLHPKSITPNL